MNNSNDFIKGYKRMAKPMCIITMLGIAFLVMIPGASAGCVVGPGQTPIEGALVKLVLYPTYSNLTDSSGCYILQNVPNGTYAISASKAGYATNTSTVFVPATQGVEVTKDFILSPSSTVFVPWTATTQGYTTPYVIANKGTSTANINIDYYNQADGSKAGSYSSLSILPGASKFVFREWNTTTDGSAVLTSDQPISVIVDQFNTGLSMFGAYEVDPSGSNEVFLPWTQTSGGWMTPYVIVNRGSANAIIDITYYNTDGTVAGSYNQLQILPGASKFVFRHWNTTTDGAAKISSTQPVSVLVDMFGPGNKFAAYTPASTADTQVSIPWTATTQGWTTPYRIVNRGLNLAVVNIQYYNQANGQQVGTDSVTINPNAVVTMSRESVPTANGTDGSAVLTSGEPISVIVEQKTTDGNYFEAYTPAISASTTVVIPWTATTQGWMTPYVIVNKGSANANININYYNQLDGSSAGSDVVSNLAPGASTFVFRPAGTDGSAVLVSNQPITAMVDQFNVGQNMFGAYTPLG